MDYEGNIFRPPSEARSLLIQVTVGCTHNRCTYCAMYRDKRFRVKPWERVAADIEEARQAGPFTRRAFLCDGDVLSLSTDRLLRVLDEVRTKLPWIERVGVYGDTRGTAGKTVEDLVRLRDAGLGIVYHGVESGDDEVLRRVDKGATRAEVLEVGRKLRAAGIMHSVIVLLGLGGVERSREHAIATAEVVTELDPAYVGALVVTLVPGTPLHAQAEAGEYVLPDRFALLAELREMLSRIEVSACRFSANHASNYLPIRGDLPRDRAALLAMLDEVIESRDESRLKPEFLRGL